MVRLYFFGVIVRWPDRLSGLAVNKRHIRPVPRHYFATSSKEMRRLPTEYRAKSAHQWQGGCECVAFAEGSVPDRRPGLRSRPMMFHTPLGGIYDLPDRTPHQLGGCGGRHGARGAISPVSPLHRQITNALVMNGCDQTSLWQAHEAVRSRGRHGNF
jgi:hypothetical protein